MDSHEELSLSDFLAQLKKEKQELELERERHLSASPEEIANYFQRQREEDAVQEVEETNDPSSRDEDLPPPKPVETANRILDKLQHFISHRHLDIRLLAIEAVAAGIPIAATWRKYSLTLLS